MSVNQAGLLTELQDLTVSVSDSSELHLDRQWQATTGKEECVFSCKEEAEEALFRHMHLSLLKSLPVIGEANSVPSPKFIKQKSRSFPVEGKEGTTLVGVLCFT